MEIVPPGSRGPYAARNALNADQLKQGITQRSGERGDTASIRAWLQNHFYRHLVSNFEPARRLHSLEESMAVLGSTPAPPWLSRFFNASGNNVPLVWVAPEDPLLLQQEALLVEFLTARKGTPLEGKLERINCPQALMLWEKEHAQMTTRTAQGWRTSQPDALGRIVTCTDHAWVELLPDSHALRAEMAVESYVMRHCLGQFADRKALTGGYGGHYADAVEQGHMRLFSLRDAQGQPHITVSLTVQANGDLTVDQVKGKQNRPPVERYLQPLLMCLNALGTDQQSPPDCIAIGVVRTQAGWLRLEQVNDPTAQTQLVARYPQLFSRLESPSAMTQWLVAARQVEMLQRTAPAAPSVRYAARHVLDPLSPPDLSDNRHFTTEGVPWVGLSSGHAAAIIDWQASIR